MSRLNKILLFLIVTLVFTGQFIPLSVSSNTRSVNTTPIELPTSTPIPTPTPIASPMSITIPKIGIAAPLEAVSTDFDGRMNMPEDYAKAAWYSSGFKPGEAGNSVIAGHLDKTTGAPALFFNLHALNPGDDVLVTDSNGKQLTFIVESKQVYLYDQAPIDLIFGPSLEKRLNLMTCTGWWNAVSHNYSHRIVIFTRLKTE